MDKGSVIEEKNGMVVEDFLQPYSEEERQEAEISRANAELIFQPAFIPFFPKMQKQYELTDTETKLFGFIWFYLSNSSHRFYFKNEQLGEILNCNPDTASRAMSALEKKGIISTSRRIKTGGGQIRYVTRLDKNYKSDLTIPTSRVASPTRQKLQTNNNTLKDNKRKDNKIILHSNGESVALNELISLFEKVNPSYERLFANTTQRASLERMVKKHGVEKVRRVIEVLPKLSEMPYAPTATTPYQLEQKLGQIISFLKKEHRKGGTVDARHIQ